MIGIPVQKANAITVAEALLNREIYQLGPHKTLIFNEDRTVSADAEMHIYNS